MKKLKATSAYRHDLKKCAKRGYDLSELDAVIERLRIPARLEDSKREHWLKGQYIGCMGCHVSPDWVLVYRYTETQLILERTGTHADIFGL